MSAPHVLISVTQLYGPKIRPFSLLVQHPSIGHIDKQGISLIQANASALLGAVHVVACDVPAHGAARLYQNYSLAVLFDTLVVDILDKLGVANIHWLDPNLSAVLWYILW